MNEKQFNALSVPQRKAIQKTLQDAGHYTGAIDGTWGATTESALQLEEKATAQKAADAEKAATAKEAAATAKEEKARTDRLAEIEAETKRETARSNAALAEAREKREGASAAINDAAALAKQLRKQKYKEDETSGWGMLAQGTATLAAPAAATTAGVRFGKTINDAMDRGQEKRNITLRGAADDRIKGLTTREGAVTGAKLAGAMPPSNSAVRVLGRAAPHAGMAALAAYKGAPLLMNVDDDQPFYPRMADRGAGLAYLGFGGGILKRGIQQAQSPGVSPDAQALSVINSSQLRRNNQATAEPDAPKLTPRQQLVAEAKAAGITNIGKKNMVQLADALRKLPKTPLIAPALTGALAYGMTPDSAQAADGSEYGGTAEALTNAGVAAGATGGIGYGMGRLSKALGAAGRGALGAAGTMTMPGAVADATDMEPEERAESRNWLARNLPQGVTDYMPAVRDAREMAQVPERAPAGGDGFGTSRSLQIPEDIPRPQPDGSLPPEMAQLEQAAADDPELAQLLQELILSRMDEAQQQEQVPTAMASQAVAQSQPSAMSAALRNLAQR